MAVNLERVKLIKDVWNNLRVPIRPGPEGLDLYRNCMKRVAKKNILVLGATPELVDMAVELKASKIISIERNPEILEAMKQLGTYDWSNVQLIADDWLSEQPDFASSFDCIVCDGGVLFLEYPGQWERLFSLVNSYLVPGGLFVAKEWAEPPGDRDYKQLKDALIREFEEESRDLNRQDMIELYKIYASELRLATMVGSTDNRGSFNQTVIVARLDSLIEELEQRFPDPEMIQLTLGAMKYLARSQPDSTDVSTGVRYEGAAKLLAGQGFESECFPLPDRPVSGGNYMFVARKK